ncbi:carbonate dehydratase [Pistricoccus aurantiacus]|uniref:Carbonic anhydrase n=1 Tax=Pistricoccus aurantiacus TaxID=1883414 RepID=A0A5B8SSC0_9GAMM|nr:carbonate dehydratase [Pistricoccus aurantiacus]QEA39969.1 carbonate dehydratase [Pistricoccus aurantiacus]
MDQEIRNLLERNRQWAESVREKDPDFFARLSQQQSPEYLWIGCSDSRVPANQIIDLPPGEVFVHRNVANLLYHTDMNAMSVVQFAVDVLKVKHILIVGHYGCGGVRAAITGGEFGVVDYWLHSLRALNSRHRETLKDLPLSEQVDRMCEINVKAQVANLSRTKIIQRAWRRDQPLAIHGWVYGLCDGHATDLDCSVYGLDQVDQLYRMDYLTPASD